MTLFSPRQQNHADLQLEPEHVVEAIIATSSEPRSIDEIISAALDECNLLPSSYRSYKNQIEDLHSRLAHGRLHLAVVGEFNRGKSTFINALIGQQLLPTSVLPITAVPTRIIYGQELSCTIHFFTSKPDLVIKESRQKIAETLLHYVAEEHNPRNQYNVGSVEVSCPAPILENGTVLIDTPGFGSTYLHNTKTALDALIDCDAALFLLSADPPMTQTEMEFLKQVKKYVPRIFFILNKVDLLTRQQLAMVDSFITDLLVAQMHLTAAPQLFHTCARQAARATAQLASDPYWAESGLETIKNGIVDFMIREKYFTLSQALNDKLKSSITDIRNLLAKEIAAYTDPVLHLHAERDTMVAEVELVHKAMEKELALVGIEKKAILKFLDEQIAAGKPKLISQLHDALTILLSPSNCSSESLASIAVALKSIAHDAQGAFETKIIAQLNRPLKKALTIHSRAFAALVQSTRSTVAGTEGNAQQTLYDSLDKLELDLERQPIQNDAFAVLKLELPWSDRLLSRQGKIKRLRQRYDYQLEEHLKVGLLAFTQQIRSGIETLFDNMGELLTTEYRELLRELEKIVSRKDTAITLRVEQNIEPTAVLAAHKAAFEKIILQLY